MVIFYATHIHAYDQYSKTEPAYAQYYYLFIYLTLITSWGQNELLNKVK
jgi:hypothetical protein